MKYLKLYEAFAKQMATQTRSAFGESPQAFAKQKATQTRSAFEESPQTSREEEKESDSPYGTWKTDISSEIKKYGEGDDENNSGVAIDPPKCQPGWHFDKEKNKCVPDSVPTTSKKLDPKKLAYATLGDCPPGKIFNPKTKTCDNAPSVLFTQSPQIILHSLINKILSILENNYDGIKNAYINIGDASSVSMNMRNLYKELKLCSKLSIPNTHMLKKKIEYFFNDLSVTSDNSGDMMMHLDELGNDLMLFEYYCGLILDKC